MRVISSNLQVEQAADSPTPFVYCGCGGGDLSSRVLAATANEKVFGGEVTITLDNTDHALSGQDYRGQRLFLGWGYLGAGASNQPPSWVVSQTDVSIAGRLATKLTAIDVWQRLGLDTVVSGGLDLQGTITGAFSPGMRITGLGSGTRAMVVYASPGYLSVNQVMGTFTNGETVVADLNSSTKIVLSATSTWGGGPGPGYNGNFTILQIIQSLASSTAGVVLDSNDGIINTSKPYYSVDNGAKALKVIQDLLARTKSYARVGEDGLIHLGTVASNPSPSFTYQDFTVAAKESMKDKRLVLPSRFLVYNSKITATATQTVIGSAQDSQSIAQLGVPITEVVNIEVQDNTEANSVAQALLRRVQLEALSGEFTAMMNVQQELWDYVEVIDSRSGAVYDGWVGAITREYKALEGVYTITIRLGGFTDGLSSSGSPDYMPSYPKELAPGQGNATPPGNATSANGQAGAVADLFFTPNNADTVSWGSGAIRFPDSTSQVINAGSRTMTSGTEYLYMVRNNPSLFVTTSLVDTVAADRLLVASLSRGLIADDMVLVIPFAGRQNLILDQIHDGNTYSRVKGSFLSNGQVKLDNTLDGTYGKVRANAILNGSVIMDQITDFPILGVPQNYAKILRSATDGAGRIALDQVIIGNTYDLIAKASIQGHQLILRTVIQETDFQTVNANEKSGAVAGYNFLVSKINYDGLRFTTQQSGNRVVFDPNGLHLYRNNALQVDIDAFAGRVTAGQGTVIIDQAGITINGNAVSLYFGNLNAFAWRGSQVMPSVPGVTGDRTTISIEAPGGLWAGRGLWVNDGSSLGAVSTGQSAMYFSTRNIFGGVVSNILMPVDDLKGQLGQPSKRWDWLYVGSAAINAGSFGTWIGGTLIADHIQPAGDFLGNIGSSGNKWGEINAYQVFGYFIHASGELRGGLVTPYHSSNSGAVGTPDRYWSAIYSWDIHYKTLSAFHGEDDLGLVKGLHEDTEIVEAPTVGGGRSATRVLANIPEEIKDESGQFISMGKVAGLLIGAVSQFHDLYLDWRGDMVNWRTGLAGAMADINGNILTNRDAITSLSGVINTQRARINALESRITTLEART